jgi:hypothetical protein
MIYLIEKTKHVGEDCFEEGERYDKEVLCAYTAREAAEARAEELNQQYLSRSTAYRAAYAAFEAAHGPYRAARKARIERLNSEKKEALIEVAKRFGVKLQLNGVFEPQTRVLESNGGIEVAEYATWDKDTQKAYRCAISNANNAQSAVLVELRDAEEEERKALQKLNPVEPEWVTYELYTVKAVELL